MQKDPGWLLGKGLEGVVFASLGCRACGGVVVGVWSDLKAQGPIVP